jgi:hypothetical protein
MAGLTPETFRGGGWRQIGGVMTAFIGGFRDASRPVGLRHVQVGEGCA